MTKHYAACLVILLSSASCMPGATRTGMAVRPTGMAAPAPRAAEAATPAPLPVLLMPPGLDDGVTASALVAPPFVEPDPASDAALRATECLTEAVYYEARSEPLDGQRAVAQVVLNRVRNPAFPASVCGVVHQRSATGGGCQFTFDCDGSTALPREPAAWDRARKVAADALAGDVYAPAGAATYYHTTAVSPWWSSKLTRIAQIGAHIFYRLGDLWSSRLDFHQSYAAIEPRTAVAESNATLTANVMRYAIADGSSIAVHRDAVTAIAGVVVHRGGMSAVADDDAGAGVHVHVGAGPTPAPAAETATADAPAPSTGPA